MMSNHPMPTFDEWVDYCFTQGWQDFNADSDDPDGAEVEARCDRFLTIDPPILADYVVKLFESPQFIADRYTDNQIADAVWFLFGVASGYFHDVFSDKIEIATQIACMRSVESFYLRLLDRVCCLHAGDPDGRYTNELKVDIAVYMIWDMGCIELGMMFADDRPHLVKPGFRVLENVLMKCRTSTCMMSVLHGLGHLHDSHPQQCGRIIDIFLGERRIPNWVRDYACDARTGHIV